MKQVDNEERAHKLMSYAQALCIEFQDITRDMSENEMIYTFEFNRELPFPYNNHTSFVLLDEIVCNTYAIQECGYKWNHSFIPWFIDLTQYPIR